jgi:hypothetical protein
MRYLLFGVLLLCFSPAPSFAAEIMFEGYYRIDLAGKHIGYSIQRYEFDPKDKTFSTISFLRIKTGNEVMQESLRAKANDKFQPVSYSYTLTQGKTVKTIDATFKGEIMKVKIIDGKKVLDQTHKLPKGTFLSSFLTYLMLQKKMSLNQAFQYSAVAEEDAASYNGKALIESREAKGSFEALRILNSFKGEKFVAKVAVVKDPKDPEKNIRGEVLSTSSPTKSISTELVESTVATEGQIVPNKILIDIFGNMPTGKNNLLNAEKKK